MIKPNWDIFKAKFSENKTENFEWFCYLLFCREHKLPKGVFRYKNQSAIETEPIKINNKVIGWQSKFYEVPLSQKNSEILETIEKTKRDYPDLTDLIFYTNQEWGQKKGKEPKGKTDAEDKAKELGIVIDWRVASFFESEFIVLENKDLVECFFIQDSGIEKAIKNAKIHTQILLESIKTSLEFNGSNIEIDRNHIIADIKNSSSRVIILSGVAGVGKTSLIKKYYEEMQKNIPFYMLKATEFLTNNLHTLFNGFSFDNFIEAHKDESDKIFVIDSSEKLLDIQDDTTIKEFIATLIKNKWKIIFTTRYNYLEQLNVELKEIYHVTFENVFIKNLSDEDLLALSKKHNFNLPREFNLKELIKNPFYLSEFLKFYQENEKSTYKKFKDNIWQKSIVKSKPAREQCFLELSKKRAVEGTFFIKPDCEFNILELLQEDGILGYETHGYFITHDIYEEWALEKNIETEFIQRDNILRFFMRIGDSLSIRRSFRNWVSEKLLLEDEDIKVFIEEIIDDNEIELFWKDEIFISILLSDYSDTFFETFEKELLAKDYELLKRISFLLRLACKEADNSLLEIYKLNLDNLDVFSIFNQPKGSGWKSFISFVHKYIDEIKLENINTILPVLYDWNLKNQQGKTTRLASLIVLKYYEWINQEKYTHDKHIQKICNVIISGTTEIQEELEFILDEIIKNKWKDSKDNYYNLSIMILSTSEGFPRAFPILKNIPQYVFKLADLFWTYIPKESQRGVFGGYEREEVETAFGLEKYGNPRYFSDSALQTPFYYLLQLHQHDTIDFVIDFVNKCVEKYSQSDWEEVIEVQVPIDAQTEIIQYHSQALWNMYRGTSSPVMPDVLKSIHMALEKYILEVIKNSKQEDIETFLKYLLIKSESSSISAIVASAILAYPDKTFNIAKILFQIKEFIQADLVRQIKDYSEAKFIYGIGYGLNNGTKVYVDERLKTCEEKHRESHLENLFLNYQMFRSEEISEEEADNRQKELWDILDNYYEQLPPKDEQEGADKTWQIFLARMDRREMDIQVKEVEKGFEIEFKGKLTLELEEYSKTSQKENSELMRYTSLNLWSKFRLENNQNYKKYNEFEKNPLLALEQLKELVETKPEERSPILQKEVFLDTAIILLRDFSYLLKLEDKELCKSIILEFSSMLFQEHYNYQMSDGTDTAISNLPLLALDFPDSKDDIKLLLMLNLFRDYEIGMSGTNVHDSAIDAIVKFYNEVEIENFVIGFLYLIPKYEKLYTELREDNWHINESDALEKFMENYQEDIKRFVANQILFEDLEPISNIEIRRLIVPMKMIANAKDFESSENIDNILLQIIQLFLMKIYSDERDNDFDTIHKFIDAFSVILLKTNKEKISNYFKPLIDKFIPTEDIAWLFTQIILTQNKINNYENFWYIWCLFEDKIIETCKDNRYWDTKKVIYAYMLVWSPYGAIWKKEAKEWHTLKEKDKRFFARISKELGQNPSLLYTISFLLNSIGSAYLNDGIKWISSMIKHNDNLMEAKLETNTIYYLEQLSRKYILNNIQEVKKLKSKKEEILIILNFLVERGSAIGYMLRERIL